MHAARLRPIERGLDRVFKVAGQNMVWYQFSGTAAGLSEFGLGVSTTYYTAYVQGIVNRGAPLEQALPGGFSEQGRLLFMIRERIGKDDMLEVDTIRYRVEGAPSQAFLGETLYYDVPVVRSE
jgi:hypothetical protein